MKSALGPSLMTHQTTRLSAQHAAYTVCTFHSQVSFACIVFAIHMLGIVSRALQIREINFNL